jgi:integrase
LKLTTVVSKYILLQRSSGMRFITTAQVLEFYCRAMGDIDVSAVNPQTVSRFLLGKGRLTRTWHQKHGILKSFYRFAIGRGYATASPLPTITPQFTSAFTPYIYSIDELRRIMAAILALRNRNTDVPPPSVRALVLLLYGTGFRLSEALSLTFADVNLRNGVLTIRDGKFYKERLVTISQRLAAELDVYARQRGNWPCRLGQGSTFFAMRDGRALKRDSIEDIWRRVCNSAAVRSADGATEQPRLHDLRHTFAVHRLVAWYREGADVQRLVYFLQVYLGHEKLAYTQRYLTMTPELLGQANSRFERYVSTEVHHV